MRLPSNALTQQLHVLPESQSIKLRSASVSLVGMDLAEVQRLRFWSSASIRRWASAVACTAILGGEVGALLGIGSTVEPNSGEGVVSADVKQWNGASVPQTGLTFRPLAYSEGYLCSAIGRDVSILPVMLSEGAGGRGPSVLIGRTVATVANGSSVVGRPGAFVVSDLSGGCYAVDSAKLVRVGGKSKGVALEFSAGPEGEVLVYHKRSGAALVTVTKDGSWMYTEIEMMIQSACYAGGGVWAVALVYRGQAILARWSPTAGLDEVRKAPKGLERIVGLNSVGDLVVLVEGQYKFLTGERWTLKSRAVDEFAFFGGMAISRKGQDVFVGAEWFCHAYEDERIVGYQRGKVFLENEAGLVSRKPGVGRGRDVTEIDGRAWIRSNREGWFCAKSADLKTGWTLFVEGKRAIVSKNLAEVAATLVVDDWLCVASGNSYWAVGCEEPQIMRLPNYYGDAPRVIQAILAGDAIVFAGGVLDRNQEGRPIALRSMLGGVVRDMGGGCVSLSGQAGYLVGQDVDQDGVVTGAVTAEQIVLAGGGHASGYSRASWSGEGKPLWSVSIEDLPVHSIKVHPGGLIAVHMVGGIQIIEPKDHRSRFLSVSSVFGKGEVTDSLLHEINGDGVLLLAERRAKIIEVRAASDYRRLGEVPVGEGGSLVGDISLRSTPEGAAVSGRAIRAGVIDSRGVFQKSEAGCRRTARIDERTVTVFAGGVILSGDTISVDVSMTQDGPVICWRLPDGTKRTLGRGAVRVGANLACGADFPHEDVAVKEGPGGTLEIGAGAGLRGDLEVRLWNGTTLGGGRHLVAGEAYSVILAKQEIAFLGFQGRWGVAFR
jgi:hypothetical protein